MHQFLVLFLITMCVVQSVCHSSRKSLKKHVCVWKLLNATVASFLDSVPSNKTKLTKFNKAEQGLKRSYEISNNILHIVCMYRSKTETLEKLDNWKSKYGVDAQRWCCSERWQSFKPHFVLIVSSWLEHYKLWKYWASMYVTLRVVTQHSKLFTL